MAFQLLKKRLEKNPRFDLPKIEKAFEMAQKAHGTQKRHSGAPFISHPTAMAKIVFDMGGDEDSIIAALLHDTVEDTKLTLEAIKKEFGEDIAFIIDGLTKLTATLRKDTSEDKQANNLRKMFEFMAEDLRIIVLKIADRLHNMRTLDAIPPKKQMEKAKETMEVYAPLTKILGLWEIKKELEDLCFLYLGPKKYKSIDKFLKKYKRENLKKLENTAHILSDNLLDYGFRGKVEVDFKGIYEIEKDLNEYNLELSEYQKPFILTVKVSNQTNCYEVMERIHSFWRPIHYNLKDYISNPKGNYYRALHTAVIGPSAKLVKVRILTEEMATTANSGVLSELYFPDYKKGGKKVPVWLKDILQMSREEKNNRVFLEELKVGILGKKIFVIGKDSSVISLPQYASGISYGILSGISIKKKWRLKINGMEASVKCVLNDGDIVEIITDERRGEAVHCLWLLYCKAYSVRLKISQYLKKIPREKAILFGMEALSRELQLECRGPLSSVPQKKIQRCIDDFECPDFDALLEKIGRGKLHPHEVYKHIFTPYYLKKGSRSFLIGIFSLKDRPGFLYDVLKILYKYKCNVLRAGGFAPHAKEKGSDVTFQFEFYTPPGTNTYDICQEVEQVRNVGECFIKESSGEIDYDISKEALAKRF